MKMYLSIIDKQNALRRDCINNIEIVPEKVGHVARKPVFGLSFNASLKHVSSATETS